MLHFSNFSYFKLIIDVILTSPLQVGVWIEAGSRNESVANNGVARLLEYLSFKVITFVILVTGH